MKKLRNTLPVVKFEGELVTYEAVRTYFGWKDNITIRRWVNEGLLTRVRIGTRSKDCRITVASVVSLREHLNKMIEDASYAEKARMQTMREKRGLPKESGGEVLLDAEEIIRQAHRNGPPPQDDTPDTGTTYTPPAPAPRKQQVGFSLRRGI